MCYNCHSLSLYALTLQKKNYVSFIGLDPALSELTNTWLIMQPSPVVSQVCHSDGRPQGESWLAHEPQHFALDVAVGKKSPSD